MQDTKKQSFLQGAFVLVMANAIVKVIGAIFKIPLTNLVGADGMGIFYVAYNLYTAMFVLSTAGLPVAISKMVAEANALGRMKEVNRIVKIAFTVFVSIGALGSIVMFLFADYFVEIVGNQLAYKAVLAIAPSIFFVSISSTFRGYYQGLSNMYPTAFSQVIESLCKLFAGYGFAYLAMEAGMGLEFAAAGAISGVTIGTFFSSIYLGFKFKRRAKIKEVQSDTSRSSKEIFKSLIVIAVPVTIGASVLSLTNLIDMAVVLNRLQDIGYSLDRANNLYGAYNMSLTLFNLPQTLITAISISIIPAISSAFAKDNYILGKKTIGSATRITILLALPCAAGLATLSKPILDLLYYKRPEDVAVATPLLQILGLAVVFVAMVSLTNAILQAIGKANIPVITMFVGGIVKLTANYILVGNNDINIHGAPIGTTLCYATITILNLIFIAKEVGLPDFVSTICKPIIAVAGMSLVAINVMNFAEGIVGSKLGVIIAIGAAAIVYLILLVLVRALEKDDILLMPKGEKIAKLFRMK